jgi:hypothetical protein
MGWKMAFFGGISNALKNGGNFVIFVGFFQAKFAVFIFKKIIFGTFSYRKFPFSFKNYHFEPFSHQKLSFSYQKHPFSQQKLSFSYRKSPFWAIFPSKLPFSIKIYHFPIKNTHFPIRKPSFSYQKTHSRPSFRRFFAVLPGPEFRIFSPRERVFRIQFPLKKGQKMAFFRGKRSKKRVFWRFWTVFSIKWGKLSENGRKMSEIEQNLSKNEQKWEKNEQNGQKISIFHKPSEKFAVRIKKIAMFYQKSLKKNIIFNDKWVILI